MLQDSEQQVRLQFLDEAQEYLDTIESSLIGISTQSPDRAGWDGVLRAAHSLKGGGAMMGFDLLSQLAHRLEDFLKILKIRPTEGMDEEIESLLLSGVDHLRDLVHYHHKATDPTMDWLNEIVYPTFSSLHDRLGDPQPDDAASLLSEETGVDMAVLLFESEVDAILARLDEVLADPHQPCLKEEFEIAAQELAGLGEMLDLPVFRDLCHDISARITRIDTSDELATVAGLAQDAWRKSQAMVLVGQRSLIPASLTQETLAQETLTVAEQSVFSDLSLTDELPFDALSTAEWDFAGLERFDEMVAEFPGAIAPTETENLDALPTTHGTEQTEEWSITTFANVLESSEPQIHKKREEEDFFGALDDLTLDLPLEADLRDVTSDLAAMDEPLAPILIKTQVSNPSADPDAIDERTIRVPASQLNQMSELFGELMIERNGLTLQLKRLRELTTLLTQRVQTLEQSNLHLREGYDKVTTQTTLQAEQTSRTGFKTPLHPSLSSISPLSTPAKLGSNLAHDFDLLEMDRYSELHSLSQELMETAVQIEEVTSDITLNLDDAEQTARAFTRTTKQIQTGMTQMRMRPIADILGRFPRTLRDLSRQYDKSVEFKINGGSTLIDRLILDTLSDSLIHLVRNAFDHGIEKPYVRLAQGKPAQGLIEISAAYRGNQTCITIRDDGGGIDLTKIREKAMRMGIDQTMLDSATSSDLLNLIFEPGFSTAQEVTDLSGRGVGMDIVRTNLQQVRGSIAVDTQLGKGTTFTISIPFTLSVIRALLVESANLLMAFPTDLVEEVLLLKSQNIIKSDGKTYLDLDGTLIPFMELQDGLKFAHPVSQGDIESTPKINEPTVLLINQNNQTVAIRVERYWGEQEVTVRQVEGNIPLPPIFAGCTVLGDGRIAPLVDPFSILQQIDVQFSQSSFYEDSQFGPSIIPPSSQETEATKQVTNPLVMVVDDSVNVRRFLALTLEKAGFRVEQAKDGQHALEKVQMGLPIQAVICDIEMPRLDGYGFLANVKAIPSAKEIPVIMLTSRSGDKHRKLAMSLGASDYFSKPFREKDLLSALNQLILQPV
jgi:two-component system, chemotaxis family, sensor histidine kinase and response regulator PixL